jgi:hypothetical protein
MLPLQWSDPPCKGTCGLSYTNPENIYTALYQGPMRLQYQEETNTIMIETFTTEFFHVLL